MVKKITIEDLAVMVQKGFKESKGEMDKGFNELREEMDGLREGTHQGFTGLRVEMNNRFNKLEHLVIADHKRRIERLEDEVKDLKNLLAV